MLTDDPQIDKEPVACGSYSNILRGYVQEQCICVKVVRLYRQTPKGDIYLKVCDQQAYM